MLIIEYLQLRSGLLEVGIKLVELVNIGGVGVTVLAVLGIGLERCGVPFGSP